MKYCRIIPPPLLFNISMLIYLSSCNEQIQNKTTSNEPVIPNVVSQQNIFSAPVESMDKNIRSIFQDHLGVFWFGTNDAGVYRYDFQTLTQYTVNDGLADNQVIYIQEDDLGNLWFESGNFAISKFDGLTFTVETNAVNVTKGSDADWKSMNKDLWFYAGAGVFRYSNSSLDYLPFVAATSKAQAQTPFSLSRYGVYSILKDNKGNIWFGTQAEGVGRYDGKTITWLKDKGLAGPAVLGLFEDSSGNIWIGNNGAGLFRYDGETLTNLTEEKGLGNADFIASGENGLGTLARIYSINEDNDGNIWVGTVDAGVWKYDGNNLTNYTTKNGLTGNAVNTIYRDKTGELWFGTDGNGICKFNGTSFTEFVIR